MQYGTFCDRFIATAAELYACNNMIFACNRGHVCGRGTRNSAVPIVEKLPERTGTASPLLKCLSTHYGRHCEPVSGQQCTRLRDFVYTISEFFRGVIPRDPRRKAPGAWTQTPISVWFVSVPTVPVLRNDHRDDDDRVQIQQVAEEVRRR